MGRPVQFVFDLDGTISDPLIGIWRSVNFALVAHDLEEVAESDVAALVGPPLDEAFGTLVPNADDQQIETLVAKYRERYAEIGFAENSIYDGMSEVLAELSHRGVSLGVCTSKRRDFAEKILDLFGIRHHFAFVDGGDVGVRKEQQLAALIGDGSIGRSARMIGDRAADVLAARANGLSAVGVLWGYGSETELKQAGAEVLINDTSELSRFFAGIGSAQVAGRFTIVKDDPRRAVVTALLQQHLAAVTKHGPPESIHALDVEGLCSPEVAFWTAWDGNDLVGCGALKQLDPMHGEIKSMHTAALHLRRGVASSLLRHMIDEARKRGYVRLSLETGSMDAYVAARSLYLGFGFEACGPFADYALDPHSIFMTLEL